MTMMNEIVRDLINEEKVTVFVNYHKRSLTCFCDGLNIDSKSL